MKKTMVALWKGKWGSLELKELRRLFPNNRTRLVAADLSRPYEAVKKRASRLGLRKSARYLKSLGRK